MCLKDTKLILLNASHFYLNKDTGINFKFLHSFKGKTCSGNSVFHTITPCTAILSNRYTYHSYINIIITCPDHRRYKRR